ncbi:Flavocytochrome c, partial [Coemansia reversa NRRL 1564]
IVVVGGGLAGMAAAAEALRMTAAQAGVTVTLVEKETRAGGNSAKASSGINGAPTRTQLSQGIHDSVEAFARDTLASGRGRSSATLVEKLVNDSAQAVAWLQDVFAVDLDVVAQLGGHSAPRTHRRPEADGKPQPVGWGIVGALARHLDAHPRFRLLHGARATALLPGSDGGVNGVEYEAKANKETDTGSETQSEKHTIKSAAVILATGGFAGSGSDGMLGAYAPHVAGLPTTNGPFAAGDGVRLGTALGAELVDMDQVQVHPTGFVRPGMPHNATVFLAAEALRGAGGVLLDARGRRFVNELDTRDHVTAAMLRCCAAPDSRARHRGTNAGPDAAAFLVLSQAAANAFGTAALKFYEHMGLVFRATGLAELAVATDVDAHVLRQTFETHDHVRSTGATDEFGRRNFPAPALNTGSDDAAEYFWAVVTPSVHYTMGGLRIDEHAHVLHDASRTPIPRLLAAGEVTGGLHGANRLAGNSLLECVVFGREAGRVAAAIA